MLLSSARCPEAQDFFIDNFKGCMCFKDSLFLKTEYNYFSDLTFRFLFTDLLVDIYKKSIE